MRLASLPRGVGHEERADLRTHLKAGILLMTPKTKNLGGWILRLDLLGGGHMCQRKRMLCRKMFGGDGVIHAQNSHFGVACHHSYPVKLMEVELKCAWVWIRMQRRVCFRRLVRVIQGITLRAAMCIGVKTRATSIAMAASLEMLVASVALVFCMDERWCIILGAGLRSWKYAAWATVVYKSSCVLACLRHHGCQSMLSSAAVIP